MTFKHLEPVTVRKSHDLPEQTGVYIGVGPTSTEDVPTSMVLLDKSHHMDEQDAGLREVFDKWLEPRTAAHGV